MLTHVSSKAQTKFGKGLSFVNQDSTASLLFHFRIQNLYTFNYSSSDNSWSQNAMVRRSRLKFDGFAFNPRLKYKLELGLTSNDISVNKEAGQTKDASRIILDAVFKYQLNKNWQVWFGQTKLPSNRERVVSSANLQFVDRSILNGSFNIDRDMGIQLHGKFNIKKIVVRPIFSVSNGEGRDLTEGNHGGSCYTSRLEILPFGSFEGKNQDYVLSDLTRQQKPKLAMGMTYNKNVNAIRQQGQLGSFVTDSLGKFVANTLEQFEADLVFKYSGFSVLAEYATQSAQKQLNNLSSKFITGTGLSIQAGYLIKSNWEFAARFSNQTPDDKTFSALKELSEYTLGLSKYLVGHSLKIQTDYSMIDNGGMKPNYRLRFQMEMQF
ncbi:MAG: porin [Bacteroidia bacterium]